MVVSGVRSSCEASAANSRTLRSERSRAANACCSRSSIVLIAPDSRPTSVRPPAPGIRASRSWPELIPSAVRAIRPSGSRPRPISAPPPSASSASSTPPVISSAMTNERTWWPTSLTGRPMTYRPTWPPPAGPSGASRTTARNRTPLPTIVNSLRRSPSRARGAWARTADASASVTGPFAVSPTTCRRVAAGTGAGGGTPTAAYAPAAPVSCDGLCSDSAIRSALKLRFSRLLSTSVPTVPRTRRNTVATPSWSRSRRVRSEPPDRPAGRRQRLIRPGPAGCSRPPAGCGSAARPAGRACGAGS